MKRLILCLIVALTIATQAVAANVEPRHGLSVFGDLKYGPSFEHFDYVNPLAPKGGAIKISGLDTFETIHPFILKGRKELLAEPLLYDTLMARSFDEPIHIIVSSQRQSKYPKISDGSPLISIREQSFMMARKSLPATSFLLSKH